MDWIGFFYWLGFLARIFWIGLGWIVLFGNLIGLDSFFVVAWLGLVWLGGIGLDCRGGEGMKPMSTSHEGRCWLN